MATPQKYQNGPRQKMIAKIHIEFPQLRPDLRHSPEELRLERLAFIERVLKLKKPLDSMKRLSDEQLGKVIEAIKREMPQRALPGCAVHHFKGKGREASVHGSRARGCSVEQMGPGETPPGEVIHLAGEEQVWAITTVFDYLRWTPDGRERFLSSKFERSSARMLTPTQANSCLMVLFNIAAHSDLKRERPQGEKITRKEIGRYIPTLKRKLGIGIDVR